MILFVLIKFLDKPDAGGIPGVSVGYGFGIFLALIAAIGVTVGGYLKLQEGATRRPAPSRAPADTGATLPTCPAAARRRSSPS